MDTCPSCLWQLLTIVCDSYSPLCVTATHHCVWLLLTIVCDCYSPLCVTATHHCVWPLLTIVCDCYSPLCVTHHCVWLLLTIVCDCTHHCVWLLLTIVCDHIKKDINISSRPFDSSYTYMGHKRCHHCVCRWPSTKPQQSECWLWNYTFS